MEWNKTANNSWDIKLSHFKLSIWQNPYYEEDFRGRLIFPSNIVEPVCQGSTFEEVEQKLIIGVADALVNDLETLDKLPMI